MNNNRGILYFQSNWCQPCKTLGSIIESLEGSGVKVKKVNIDYDTMLTQQYNIKSTPTLILTDLQGNELGRKVGMQSKQQIIDWYNG